MSLTPEQRALRARIAAHTRWSKARDRAAELAKARAAFKSRFEQEVDPNNEMTPEARALAAESARKAYYTRLAYKSALARSKSGGVTDAA